MSKQGCTYSFITNIRSASILVACIYIINMCYSFILVYPSEQTYSVRNCKRSLGLEEIQELEFNKEILAVKDEYGGTRVDAFLSACYSEQSRSYFGSLCQQGFVLVDGRPVKKSAKVVAGQTVEVTFIPTPEMSAVPENITLDIIHEDSDLIAVNKPPGMVVHPAPGSWNGTFVNALLFHLLHQQGEERSDIIQLEGPRPGIVHRLDKGTSGVLVAAKNTVCHAKLSSMFASRELTKTYLAICVGNPGRKVVIESLIGRHPKDRQKMAVLHDSQGGGKFAKSFVDTLAFDGQLSLVAVRIETGRTHQIRVHLSHRRTPILGDEVYGNAEHNVRAAKRLGINRPLLHAYELQFIHPIFSYEMNIKAKVPSDMSSAIFKIYPQLMIENPQLYEFLEQK